MKRMKIIIKNSSVTLGDGALAEEIRRFDLSHATPVDCMLFIRKLKERYGSR